MTVFSDPLLLFEAAVTAIRAADFRGAAELCDAASLREFHRSLRQQYGSRPEDFVLTVEKYQQMHPDMPADVVAYHVELHERHRRDPAMMLRRDLPGVATVDELTHITPVTAFAAWLEGRSPQAQLQRAVAEGHISAEDATLVDTFTDYPYHSCAVGVVIEDDRLAHVLYRDHDAGEVDTQSPEYVALSSDDRQFARDTWGRTHLSVATCRRQHDGTWRLLASHTFLALGNMSFAYSIERTRDESGEPPDDETGGS